MTTTPTPRPTPRPALRPPAVPVFRSRLSSDPSVLTVADIMALTRQSGADRLVFADCGTAASWPAVMAAAKEAGVMVHVGMDLPVSGHGRVVLVPRRPEGLATLARWAHRGQGGEPEIAFAEVLSASEDFALISPAHVGVVAHAGLVGGEAAARRVSAALGSAYGARWSVADGPRSHPSEARAVDLAREHGAFVAEWTAVGRLTTDDPEILAVAQAAVPAWSRYAASSRGRRPTGRAFDGATAVDPDALAWLARVAPVPVHPTRAAGVPRPVGLPEDPVALVQVLRDRALASIRRHIPLDRHGDYTVRLDRELKEMARHGALDLVAIQATVLAHAHTNGIRPILRGSACNSLALVALTDFSGHVDPVRDGLLFARFLNADRPSFDVDLDCPGDDIPMLAAGLEAAYGAASILRVVRPSVITGSAAMSSQAASTGHSKEDGARWAKPFKSEKSPKGKVSLWTRQRQRAPRARSDSEELARNRADRVVGMIAEWTLNTGGYVIADANTRQHLMTQGSLSGGNTRRCVATPTGGRAIAALGLTKIDLLPSNNLPIITAFERAVTAVGGPSLARMPRDDGATMAALRDPVFLKGTPHIGAPYGQEIVAQMHLKTTADVVACSALARPGPGKLAAEFAARAAGRTPVVSVHPRLAAITSDTYGLYLYQEQWMETALALGGDTRMAEVVLQAMKKPNPASSARVTTFFADRASALGWAGEEALPLLQAWQQSAGYTFPKGHALQYGMQAYSHAFYRANYPDIVAAVAVSPSTPATASMDRGLSLFEAAPAAQEVSTVAPGLVDARDAVARASRPAGAEQAIAIAVPTASTEGRGGLS